VSERPAPESQATALDLHRWFEAPVLSLAAVVALSGFGQFGAIAALADVAAEFGTIVDGDDLTLAEQAGLSGTVLGVGLAVIRFASLASLPLAGVADAWGRRRSLLALVSCGLLLVVLASTAPSYWTFVALFALSRPLLTAATAVATTSAAEQTATSDRSSAVALLAAGFGVGAGAFAVARSLLGEGVGFRPFFASAGLGLVVVAIVARTITEPDRFERAQADPTARASRLGGVGRRHWRRLLPVLGMAFAVATVTGPANSFVFLYLENILELPQATTAVLVVGSGLAGLVGLLIGRVSADRFGRRPTVAAGLLGVAAAGILTYSGSRPAAALGYLGAVAAGSVFSPAAGSIYAELFPTTVRATVAGWAVAAGVLGAVTGLLAFGAIADHLDRFDLAALAVFLPAACAVVLVRLVPETRDLELEQIDD
jgi:predicted MFS family arabinose efflux permease